MPIDIYWLNKGDPNISIEISVLYQAIKIRIDISLIVLIRLRLTLLSIDANSV